jgi:transposase
VDDRLNRHDLTDREWERLVPLPPAQPRQGHRWNDHRMVINGVFFRTRTGCPWRDLPERFGNWKTVYNRHRRWSGDGTWEVILGQLRAGCDAAQGPADRSLSRQPESGVGRFGGQAGTRSRPYAHITATRRKQGRSTIHILPAEYALVHWMPSAAAATRRSLSGG